MDFTAGVIIWFEVLLLDKKFDLLHVFNQPALLLSEQKYWYMMHIERLAFVS